MSGTSRAVTAIRFKGSAPAFAPSCLRQWLFLRVWNFLHH
jgi:hypothetical protein